MAKTTYQTKYLEYEEMDIVGFKWMDVVLEVTGRKVLNILWFLCSTFPVYLNFL